MPSKYTDNPTKKPVTGPVNSAHFNAFYHESGQY